MWNKADLSPIVPLLMILKKHLYPQPP